MKIGCLFILFLTLCVPKAHAFDQVLEEQKDLYGLYEVADAADLNTDTTLNEGLHALLMRASREFRSILTKGLECVAVVLAISALCGVVETLFQGDPPFSLSVASSLTIMCVAAGSVTSLIGMGQSAINEINCFSKVLLPSLATAGAASGTPLGATAQYSITILFSDVLLSVITSVFIPLVYAYLATVTADSALGNHSLGKIAEFIKWIISGSLKLFLMVFVGYLTASGLISATTDIVGVKTAQFAISGMVPVVGGILSDAGEAVIAGALIVKNSIGVIGMLGLLSIILTPFLTLAVNYCLLKAAAALSEPMCDTRLGKLLNQISSGVGIVLGMTGASALLLFVSIVSGMYLIGAA